MAVDVATVTESKITFPRAGRVAGRQYTAVAVYDGEQWSALCLELDIASDGETAEEAVVNVKNAVRAALEVAAEQGISAGQPMSRDDLYDFLTSHQPSEEGNLPIAYEVFFIS